MIVTLAALVIVMGLTAAAFAAVRGDLPLTSNDSSQKQAYAAAQAGIQNYLFNLDQDSEYWTQCVPTGSTWINNAGASPLNAKAVAGSTTERYAVELLPAAGQTTYTQCSKTNPVASMIQATGNGAGTIRIRSTGYSGGVDRTIVANLREQSFLDYEWFTNYETSDPILQVAESFQGNTTDTSIEPPDLCALNPSTGCGSNYTAALTGAAAQCAQYRYPSPSGSTSATGYNRYVNNAAGYGAGLFYSDNFNSRRSNYDCDAISFISQDSINGPFHTNDQPQLCGTPTFGRTSADNIEFGYSPGYVQSCSGTPTIRRHGAGSDQHPAASAVQRVAEDHHRVVVHLHRDDVHHAGGELDLRRRAERQPPLLPRNRTDVELVPVSRQRRHLRAERDLRVVL